MAVTSKNRVLMPGHIAVHKLGHWTDLTADRIQLVGRLNVNFQGTMILAGAILPRHELLLQ